MINPYIHNSILCLFAFPLLMCCTTAPSGKMMRTANGFEMKMIVDKPGDVPKEGDMLLYGIQVFAKDSLLNSTFGQEYHPEFKWIPEEEQKKIKNPVVDAFSVMSEGDSAVVYYPADSISGNKFGLKSGENLMYAVRVFDIMGADDYATYAAERQQKLQAERAKLQVREEEGANAIAEALNSYNEKIYGDDLMKTESGLEYVIHEKGSGPLPKIGKNVSVNYYGVLKSDGSMFDNSFKRGQTFTFPLGQGRVIKGWDEGVALLPIGSKATLFIPSGLAYGATERPGIPANSDLVFYIEVLDK